MKRILLTGASRGLGRAIACLLDGLGHQTVLVARDQGELSQLQAQLRHAHGWAADLSLLENLETLVHRAIATLGGLDVLINNAGTIEPIASLAKADPRAWTRAVDLNLNAPALLMRAALPELEKSQGRVLNISTGAAVKPMPGWGAYCAAKAGLLHLSAVVAAELPHVGCFSLRPGVIDTDMQATIRKGQGAGMRAEDLERFQRLHREGGLEPPEVPARAAVWLALEGPAELSGKLVDYTDPQVLAGVEKLFGKSNRQEQ